MAFQSEADVLGFGGAAGGGKTDLMLGLAHTQHWNTIIFRRELAQLQGIEDRAHELFDGHGRFNSTKHRWRLEDGRRIEFGGVEREDDVNKYQGRPHDLKCFDELTHFSKRQFLFLSGWNRTSRPNQRTRIVAGFNPPFDAEGDWVIEYFAPWLSDLYPRKRALPGELRWFAMIDGVDREVRNGLPFWHTPIDGGQQELIEPKSRTFIPSRVEDNPIYMATGYRATLQAMPEPLRSLMLYGKFGMAQMDHPWQVIPTAWVRDAQTRWKKRAPGDRRSLTQVGVDPARGGGDKTVIAPRYGNHVAELVSRPGKATPDGQSVIREVVDLMGGDYAPIHIDAIGIGAAPVDIGVMFGLPIMPMVASGKSYKTVKGTKLGFANKKSEWIWKLREALDPKSGEDIELPPDPELRADLCASRYELKSSGVAVESKDDVKLRIHRSPDKGEAVINAFGLSGREAVIAGPIVLGAPRAVPGG